MADGYARAARRSGICMAQHIGASNLAAGLRDPYMACSPVIAITGSTLPENRYRHAYQDIEDFGQFDPVTKMNCRVEARADCPICCARRSAPRPARHPAQCTCSSAATTPKS